MEEGLVARRERERTEGTDGVEAGRRGSIRFHAKERGRPLEHEVRKGPPMKD